MELVRKEILDLLEQVPIIDTHEHLCPPRSILDSGPLLAPQIFTRSYVGFFDFFPGFKPEHQRYARPVLAPTNNMLDFANFVLNFNNDYFRESLNRGLQKVDGISLDNWSFVKGVEMEKKIRAFYATEKLVKDPAFLKTSLQQFGNIKCSVLDVPYGMFGTHLPRGYQVAGDNFFRAALRINSLLFAFDPTCWNPQSDVFYLRGLLGLPPREEMTFENFVDALHIIVERAPDYWVAIKLASAYERTLDFGRKPTPQELQDMRAKAALIFNKSLKNVPWDDALNFGNFVLREILSTLATLPGSRRLPVQVHTGTAIIQGSDPRKFYSIVEEFPNITFSFLHAGFPWWREMFFALNIYPNITADAVWLPLLSPVETIHFFKQMIQEKMSDRVCAYGGDCACVEGSIGALESTKRCLGMALEASVQEKLLMLDDVGPIIENVFYNNPRQLFKFK